MIRREGLASANRTGERVVLGVRAGGAIWIDRPAHRRAGRQRHQGTATERHTSHIVEMLVNPLGLPLTVEGTHQIGQLTVVTVRVGDGPCHTNAQRVDDGYCQRFNWGLQRLGPIDFVEVVTFVTVVDTGCPCQRGQAQLALNCGDITLRMIGGRGQESVERPDRFGTPQDMEYIVLFVGQHTLEFARCGHDERGQFRIATTKEGMIYSSSSDKTARIHKFADGGQVFSLAGHTDWVYSVAFNAPTKRVAAGSYTGEVRLWNAEDGKEVKLIIAAPGYTAPAK